MVRPHDPGDVPRRGAALITGASSGIGLELARLLAADGHPLVLVARSVPVLESLADELRARHGTACRIVPADLSAPGAAATVTSTLESDGVAIEILVNNAGYGLHGPFVELPEDDELAMIQLNVVALTQLTRRLLPGMLARGRGRILNVASVASYMPGPRMAVYHATKAYVLSLSQALAEELSGTGVTVTALCPGPTRSGFQARAGTEHLAARKRAVMLDAATVARAGRDALLRGERVVVPGVGARLLVGASRLLPDGLLLRLMHRAQR